MTTQRDALASQMGALLQGAALGNQHLDAGQVDSLISQGQSLLAQANTLAALLA